MSYVVAFDTATDHLAVGIGSLTEPGTLVASYDADAVRAANTALLPLLQRMLAEADIGRGEVDAIACGTGPGSFTGVRIAVATAKGLAHGLGVPLVGFGTLEALAWRCAEREALVGVVGDAMRGEVYPALFRVSPGRAERLEPDRVAWPEDVAEAWAVREEPILLTGSGLRKHREVFERLLGTHASLAEDRLWVPTGGSLLRAAWGARGPASLSEVAALPRAQAFARAHPHALLPTYTRLSDAEEAERRSAHGDVPAGGVAGPEGGST